MIRTTKDGRTIRTGKHYSQFRAQVFLSQNAECGHCGTGVALSSPPEWASSFHLHHKNGRGMGGGKRNDIPSEVEGLCRDCHQKEHHQ